MPQAANALPPSFEDRVWQLPPLILHPFSDQAGPGKLLEGSRATLMLAGLLSSESTGRAELRRRLMEGRYCEIRMLYYVGKDVQRWVGQCLEMTERLPELASSTIRPASFSHLLLEDPPAPVLRKLRNWGVADHKRVFSRALGLNALFRRVPSAEELADDFLQNYHRYADALYACSQLLEPFTEIHGRQFPFDLYTSGEFSRLLQEQWNQEAAP